MIYIVEDDSAIRELEQYALQSNGYEAVGFESSEPFWQAVHTTLPELVILDVMLPGEDGFSILKKLRAAPSLRRLPIIMITAKSSELDTLRGKALHWAAKVFPTHTELRLNPDAAPANGQTYEPVVNWLPVGLTLEEQRSDCGFSNYHYTDSDGCWLDVELLLFSSGGAMSLDTENADVRETVISGYPAITIHKEGVSVAACTLEDLNAILLVTGQGFSVDDVVRVAESVRLQ